MAISTAVDASAVARVLGIKTKFVDRRGSNIVYLPQRLMVVGQGSTVSTYSTTKAQHTNAYSVAQTYGFGSPLHLVALQLMPANGDGVGTIPVTFYPLADHASGVASTGDITPTGAQIKAEIYVVKIGAVFSQPFVIAVGASIATTTAAITEAINSVLEMPVTALDGSTVVNLTSKWRGASANDIKIEVFGSSTAGTSFATSQMSGGLVNPDVSTALNQIGNVWESMILNCLNVSDTDALDAIQVFGDGRWGALTRKPLISFVGNTATTVADATVISDARRDDKVNSQLVAPGSKEMPFVVAARQLARIAVRANNNPAFDYGSLNATGLEAGIDGDQWDYAARDEAVKKGSSTIEVKDGVINVSDVVTFYHPLGEPLPAYRFVVDIVKLQNIIFNVDLKFANPKWDGAPLIPNDQPTFNRDAKKPRDAIAEAAAVVDGLGLQAIISNPENVKKNIQAEIDSSNPKRLNMVIPPDVSGNTNIKSIDLEWGFNFGSSSLV